MTPAETAPWAYLRRKQVGGLRFRRQHVIGPYIVDFCCVQAHLVVEVDGGVHDELQERGGARDAALADRGYNVLHVSNDEVLEKPGAGPANRRRSVRSGPQR
jgi:very-short-patch-repair endonuclease